MINFLVETLNELSRNGKFPKDVYWVGNSKVNFTWNDFESIANFEYDDGFGGHNIPLDLIVVGKDFWLERHEYDGSEWWEYKSLPQKPTKVIKPKITEREYGEYSLEEVTE